MLRMLPTLPILRMLPVLPMLRILPALPRLRMLPALSAVNIPKMLKILRKLLKLNRLFITHALFAVLYVCV